jgi:hypothetical protein
VPVLSRAKSTVPASHGLADLGAALEWNELHVDLRGLRKLQRAEARGDGAGAHVELAGIGLGLGD